MSYTVAEVADRLGVEREVARGLVLFLVDRKLAEIAGGRRNAGRGGIEKVYSFVDGYDRVLGRMLAKAKLL